MISNIIWDVDGTLFNTYPAITYALSKSLNRMGKPVPLNLIDGLVRQSFQHCVDTLCRRYKVDANLLREQFAGVYRTVSPQNQPLMEGACEVSKWITAHGGKNVATINRDNGDVRRLFSVHNIAPFFSGVYHISLSSMTEQLGIVLREHALKPEETLVIGDHQYDVQAGRDAGCQTCLVGDEVPVGQVDMCIGDYSQLLGRLQAQVG